MTREEFIKKLTAEKARWDLTIESDCINGGFISATVTSYDLYQVTIKNNLRDSITIDISETEIEVVKDDYQYSFEIAGIKFTICESMNNKFYAIKSAEVENCTFNEIAEFPTAQERDKWVNAAQGREELADMDFLGLDVNDYARIPEGEHFRLVRK